MKTSDNVDILILAPLPLEIDALREVFSGYSPKHAIDEQAYDECEIEGRKGKLNIRVVKLPDAGVLRAGVFATKLLREWQPRYVVSFGIAGGFCDPNDEEAVKLEDVLLAEHVFYYELAKETQGSVEQRPEIFPASTEFPRSLRNFLDNYSEGLDCRIHVGKLASGEKLIDDPKSGTRKAIKLLHPKMLGFEQEAAGVAAAAQWSSLPRKTGFIVVKGISDCGENKPDSIASRVPSANNAALVVRRLLERTELAESVEYDLSKVLQKAQTIQEKITPYLAEPLSVQALMQFSDSADQRSVVFYRWRARHNNVHWVDFYHLLLLRRLNDFGLKAHLLLTEVEDVTTSQGKHNIGSVIEAVVGKGTKVTWYSELPQFKDQYVEHSKKKGFDESASKAIASAKDSLEVQSGSFVDADSLQFIAWSARSSRCFILTWQRRAAFATELTKLLGLEALALLTPDLRIGRAWGKFDEPSANLVIDPPGYASVFNWLQGKPDKVHVQDLARHLTRGETVSDKPSRDAAALIAASHLQALLDTAEEEFIQGVNTLANAFSNWNAAFFKGDASPYR